MRSAMYLALYNNMSVTFGFLRNIGFFRAERVLDNSREKLIRCFSWEVQIKEHLWLDRYCSQTCDDVFLSFFETTVLLSSGMTRHSVTG